jgi:HEAT repeat protein
MNSRSICPDSARGRRRLVLAAVLALAGCDRQAGAPQGRGAAAASRPGPVAHLAPFLEASGDMRARADRILSEARSKKAGFVPSLLQLVKDRSHSAFMLVPDASAPFGLRVEENPFGGDDLRPLDRIAAIVALQELGTPQALPELLLALDDRDGLPAVHAAEALLALGNRAGVPVLLTALEHKAYENENANRILMRISGRDFGFDSDSGMSSRWPAVERWRAWWAGFSKTGEKLKGEGQPYRKGQDPDADARIARYVDVAGEFQYVFMEQSRKMLTRLGAPAVPFLEDGLARANGPERATWRGEIARVLGGIPDPASHEVLAALLADPHPSVRARSLDGILSSAAPDAADLSRRALKDPDPSVVLAAVRALGRVGGREDLAAFAALDRKEPEVVREVDCARLRLAPSAETFDAAARHVLGASILGRTCAFDALNALAGRVVLDDPNASEDARRAALDEWRKSLPK